MEVIIKPKKTFSWHDIKEITKYHELLYFFIWRDLKVRYKQTSIGIAWALFQPVITMIIFSIVFGRLAKMPSDGVPYPIFIFIGLLLWQFFSGALSETSNCLISNQAIITKIYFPRLILPLSTVITRLVDFFVASIILIGLMVYYHYTPNLIGLLVLPILLFISFMASVGGGLFLAAVNVKYRDVRYALPFFIQILLFITPVIYPPSIAGKYSWILAINPMTGVIKAARAALTGNAPINWELLLISGLGSLLLLFFGVIYFKRTEKYFADII